MKRALFLSLVLSLTLLSCSRKISLEKARSHQLEQIEKNIFVLLPEQKLAKDSLLFERIKIELSDRILYANWISAGKNAPAFFILHGNGETLSDWKPLQVYLLKKGYSSFVFDYTGFGSSTGQPSVLKLNDDAIEAYKKFASLTSTAIEKIAFAHSLGCCMLLEDANKFHPSPDRVVTHGAFTTLREMMIEKHFISDSLKMNYPDIWNGYKNIQKLKMPLYIVHSVNDKTIPFAMGEALAKSGGSKVKFLKLETPNHNAVYEIPTDSTWNPIFSFIK